MAEEPNKQPEAQTNQLVECQDCEQDVQKLTSVECSVCGKAFDICKDCEPVSGDVYVCDDCDQDQAEEEAAGGQTSD